VNLKYIFKIIDIDEWQKVKDQELIQDLLKIYRMVIFIFQEKIRLKGTLEKILFKSKKFSFTKG